VTADDPKSEKWQAEGPIWALLFAVALGVRLIRLFDLDIWFDEAVIVLQLQKSFAEIWNICKTDNYPPLYLWLMKIWSSAFPGEGSLRLGTALMGSLTPPAAYALGKTLLDRRLGWALGIACVLSPSLIYQHQMIRMYSLFTFFACLSLVGFLRALRTNRWQDWILTAAANLLGFYTFLFMTFLIVAEILVVIWHYRLAFAKYFRPLVSQMPAILLMLIWALIAMQRAQQIREDFLLAPFSLVEIGKLWVFWGTGLDFENQYWLTLALNLPLLMGVLFALSKIRKYPSWGAAAALLLIPFVLVSAISLAGQSIFHKRYFLFLLPIYLALGLAGWFSLSHAVIRRLGIALFLCILLGSSVFYFVDYYGQHVEYGFIRGFAPDGRDNGRALSQGAALLKERLEPDEVIVHFSSSMLRSFSFFPMIWYHGRALPEFIYSVDEVHTYFGGQYLQPGDRIRSLKDLQPPLAGVWLVSLDSTEIFFDDSTLIARITRSKWLDREDFPRELAQAGFIRQETIHLGRVTLMHYRRERSLG